MKIILVLLFVLPTVTSFSQNDPQKIIDHFFSLYKEKNPDAALDFLFGTNKWMNDSKDQIGNVKSKLNGTIKQLGTYNGYNLICKKTIGGNLSLYTFIVRYDRQPLRFSLLFYNPSSQWRLQNFSYDDDMDEELREAAKADRLKENLDY